MTPEELLKPRFEVIADYPGNPFPVGFICSLPFNSDFYRKYPHLFRELQWFEYRKENEMPKYLKHSLPNMPVTYHKADRYSENLKVWFTDNNEDWGNIGMWAKEFNYMPCSEEEYLQNTKQNDTTN